MWDVVSQMFTLYLSSLLAWVRWLSCAGQSGVVLRMLSMAWLPETMVCKYLLELVRKGKLGPHSAGAGTEFQTF